LEEKTINMLNKVDIMNADKKNNSTKKHRKSIYLIADLDHIEIQDPTHTLVGGIISAVLVITGMLILAFITFKKDEGGKWVLRNSAKNFICCKRF
jgi:hypothetical protein